MDIIFLVMGKIKISKSSIYILLVFLFYYITYVFLIPNNENPDESRHIRSIFEYEETFHITGDGELYFAFQKGIADYYGFEYKKSYDRKKTVKQENTDFKYFSNDYRYNHDSIFPEGDLIYYRLANLIVLIPLFFWFLQNKNNRFLFVIAMCFPGFVWFLTCLNPDIFNIAFGIIFYNLRHKSKKILIPLLVLGFFTLDRSIILFIMAVSIFYIYQFFFRSKIFKKVFWILFLLSLFFLYDISGNILSLEYEYEPIKSIFTVILSFYGLLGNMSIRATFVEYILILLLLLVLIIRMFFYDEDENSNTEIKSFGTLITIFFVLWCYLLSLVPTLDQGRYFYPIIFYLLYLVKELFFKNKVLRSNLILATSFTINSIMFLKLIYVYYTH